MFEDVLGETGATIAQFGLALVAVIALIFIVAWLLKRFGLGKMGGHHGEDVELEVVTSIHVDSKRKLVLVRHGRLEHLLLIGGGSDEVVERSMVGGIPLSARMQASKAQERQEEPAARPADRFRTSNRFSSLLSRKKEDEQAVATSASSDAVAATAAAAAPVEPSPVPPSPASAPAKPPAAQATPKTQPPAPAAKATDPNDPLAVKPPKTEQDAIKQSVDKALSESLLDSSAKAQPEQAQPSQPAAESSRSPAAPAPSTPAAPPASDLDTSALERELEAALELDGFEGLGSDTSDSGPPLPDLPDLSTLTDDTNGKPPATADAQKLDKAKAEPTKKPEATPPSAPKAEEPAKTAEDPLDLANVKDAAPSREPTPAPDIPVALSGRDEPPIAVAIPTRGPASNATTLAKAEDASPAADAPAPDEAAKAVDISGKLQPAPKGQSPDDDLDGEMRRLLGEIAGEPTPK